MRSNPFLRGLGRRRAAMTGGEVPTEEELPPAALEGEANDSPVTADEAPASDGGGGSGFGFAYRGQSQEDATPPEIPPLQAEAAKDGQPDTGQSGPHRTDGGVPIPAGLPARAASVPSGPAPQSRRTPPSDGPVMSTPHLDRLRAQFDGHMLDGDMEAISERWGLEGTGRPNAGSAERQLSREGDDDAGVFDPAGSRRHESATSPRDVSVDRWDETDAAAEDELVEDDEPDFDPAEEVAVTIGRVVSIRGSVVWGALFDDIDGKASKAARMGALVSMRGPDSRVFGIVNRLEREQQAGNAQAERTVFEIQILGEIADEKTGFQRGVSSYPPLDAPVTTITIRDIATIYARPRTSNVHIGRLRHNAKVPAFVLTDSLLGKHFAVLGTTGTGKSCATTVILRSILDEHPEGHVVLVDPHNEYGAAFSDRAELLHPGNLQLPYWLLNFEEIAHVVLHGASREHIHSQGALLKSAIIQAKTQFAGGNQDDNLITVDTPVPYRLSDLVSILKEGMGTFNKAEGASLYLSLINRIESLRADKRFAFMFSSIAVRDNMEQVLAQLLRIPTDGKPITIIDISGLPSDVVDVVVSVLFRLTFELAVWSERGKAPPVLLVCEEAHRYVPEESDVGFAPTKRVIAQIAKEGRKYGVTLCLVSQRPSELAVSSLAQCNTIFALRMSNEHDQAFVGQALSENARWLVDSLPSLNTQEAVVVGDGVTVPVHIRFKDLPKNHRPASHDPSFSENWRRKTDPGFLSQAIDRWRRQAR